MNRVTEVKKKAQPTAGPELFGPPVQGGCQYYPVPEPNPDQPPKFCRVRIAGTWRGGEALTGLYTGTGPWDVNIFAALGQDRQVP